MKKITLVSLAVFVCAPSKVPATTPLYRPGLSIVSLNLAKETSAERILAEFRTVPALRDADLFMFQEVSDGIGGPSVADRLGSALGFHVAYSPAAEREAGLGLAILSRYPLRDIQIQNLKRYDLSFHTRTRFVMNVTVDTPWGPLSLSDAHLDTRLNTADRLAQLEPVVRESAAFRGSRVIAGDFNSNPFYWVRHVLPLPAVRSQASGVNEFMQRNGFRSAFSKIPTTFDHFGMGLDWIWMDGLQPVASRVFPLDFSDHHAVWTRVEF